MDFQFCFPLAIITSIVVLVSAVYGIKLDTSKVQLRRSGSLGTILVAKHDIIQGESILTVPSSLCLFAHRCGAVRGLLGQSDMSFDLCGDLRYPVPQTAEILGRTWDVQLALALLDATSHTNCADPIWNQYIDMLPKPEFVTLPFCMSKLSLLQLGNPTIVESALKQKERLRDLFPLLTRHEVHPVTAVSIASIGSFISNLHSKTATTDENMRISTSYHAACSIPTPLEWAFAMVRSRCFQPYPDWFTMVPILDMANHVQPDKDPAAAKTNPSSIEDGDYITGTSAQYIWHDAGLGEPAAVGDTVAAEHYFTLRARRRIAAGEEVTISYGSTGYSNDQLLVQYGFHIEGNAQDLLWDIRRMPPPELRTADVGTDELVKEIVRQELPLHILLLKPLILLQVRLE